MARGNGLKGAAGQIFALQKGGQNVPPMIRGSARRILQGTGSETDARAVRGYLGISRGGGSVLRGIGGALKSASGELMQLGSAIEGVIDAQQGGRSTGIATMRLADQINTKITAIVESKSARAVAMQTGRFLKKIGIGDGAVSGLRAMNAAGRMARFAGGALGIAQWGSMVAEGYYNREKNNAIAQRSLSSVTASYGSVFRGRDERKHALQTAYASTGMLDHMLAIAGLGESAEQKAVKIAKDRASGAAMARQAPGVFGVDEADAVAQYARKNKLIQRVMTDEQREAALDEALREYLTKIVPEQRVTSEMKLRGMWDTAGNRALLRDELRPDQVKLRIQDRVNMEKAAEKLKTPAQKYDESLAMEASDAQYRAHLSRHRAWSND